MRSLGVFNESLERYCKDILKEEEEIKTAEDIFHNDNGTDYKIIERSKDGSNCLLKDLRGNRWIIAWNCPKENRGSWGQGHYFFDEEKAKEVWEDKYKGADEEVEVEDEEKTEIKEESLKNSEKKTLKEDSDKYTVIKYDYDKYQNRTGDIVGEYNNLEEAKNCADSQFGWDEYGTTYVYDNNDAVVYRGKKMSRNESLEDNVPSGVDYDASGIGEALRKSIKKVLRTMNEANMSDEDRRDSEILRGIYQKMQKRANAKLTPEEKAVLDKYGIYRLDKTLAKGNSLASQITKGRRGSRYYTNVGSDTDINLADWARKANERELKDKRYATNKTGWRRVSDTSPWQTHQSGMHNYTYQQKERNAYNDYLRDQSKIDDMKRELYNRNRAKDRLSNIDNELEQRLQFLDSEKERARKDASFEKGKEWVELTGSQSNIDHMLKRKTESLRRKKLKESRDEDYYHRPTRFYTNGLIELMDEGVVDPKYIAESLASWMSEDDVEEFCETYDLMDEIERNAGWDVDGEMDESYKNLTESKNGSMEISMWYPDKYTEQDIDSVEYFWSPNEGEYRGNLLNKDGEYIGELFCSDRAEIERYFSGIFGN